MWGLDIPKGGRSASTGVCLFAVLMGHIELAVAEIRRKMAAITPVKVGTATCIKNPNNSSRHLSASTCQFMQHYLNGDRRRAVMAGASGGIQTQDPRHRPDSLPTVENCHCLSVYIAKMLPAPASYPWRSENCVADCNTLDSHEVSDLRNRVICYRQRNINFLSINLTEVIKLLACIWGFASFESGPAHPTSSLMFFVVFLSQPRKLRDST
jgi:hypothetical protein